MSNNDEITEEQFNGMLGLAVSDVIRDRLTEIFGDGVQDPTTFASILSCIQTAIEHRDMLDVLLEGVTPTFVLQKLAEIGQAFLLDVNDLREGMTAPPLPRQGTYLRYVLDDADEMLVNYGMFSGATRVGFSDAPPLLRTKWLVMAVGHFLKTGFMPVGDDQHGFFIRVPIFGGTHLVALMIGPLEDFENKNALASYVSAAQDLIVGNYGTEIRFVTDDDPAAVAQFFQQGRFNL